MHATRLQGGRARYSGGYVATAKLAQERAAGKPLFINFGDQTGLRGLAATLVCLLKSNLKARRAARGGARD